ncbi:MAG: hypothetical protein R3288_14715 [Woeseiaceae bacterium]|nr:hypothetical protein [Woeseiaceae bacterium]
MQKRLLVALSGMLLPVTLFAQNPSDFECSFGDLNRRLVIVSEPGVSVPCEVHYYKEDEAPGEHQVLWRATNEAGYCERQADQFKMKLIEWGWTCTDRPAPAAPADQSVDEPGDDAPPMPVDDTDVLEPGFDDEPGDNS